MRLTADIAIFPSINSEKFGREVIYGLGLEPFEVREAQLKGGPLHAIKSKTTPIQIILGRNSASDSTVGIDFLLPSITWVSGAVKRAQENIKDIGFGLKEPVLTLEDLIVSKLFSFQSNSSRVKDLDDLSNILAQKPRLNNEFLASQISALKLKIPPAIKDYFHYKVLRVERKIKNSISF